MFWKPRRQGRGGVLFQWGFLPRGHEWRIDVQGSPWFNDPRTTFLAQQARNYHAYVHALYPSLYAYLVSYLIRNNQCYNYDPGQKKNEQNY